MGIYGSLVCETDSALSADLGRRWDLLDYLLTKGRTAAPEKPAAFLSFNGWEELASEAHRIPSDSVKAVASWLDAVEDTDLLAHFDPEGMTSANIYDADLAAKDPGAYKDMLAQDLVAIRTIFSAAAKSGENVIRIIG